MKINSIIDLVKDLDTSRQTKNLNKLLIRILLHLQVEFSTFNGMEESNIITGTLSGTVITSTFTGSWSANGKDNQFNASIQGGNESSDILAKNFIEGLNNATSYGGDERNLYLYYKPSGSQQTLSLVFHVVK